jgi:hypothetical protein
VTDALRYFRHDEAQRQQGQYVFGDWVIGIAAVTHQKERHKNKQEDWLHPL